MTPDFIRSNGVMTLNVYRAYLYLYKYSTLPRGGRDVSPPQNAHNRVVRVCCVRWTSGVCNRPRCQNPALRVRPGPSEATVSEPLALLWSRRRGREKFSSCCVLRATQRCAPLRAAPWPRAGGWRLHVLSWREQAGAPLAPGEPGEKVLFGAPGSLQGRVQCRPQALAQGRARRLWTRWATVFQGIHGGR